MNKLTGDKNIDIEIINQLSDRDLSSVCQVNSYVRKLCNDNTLWRKRISLVYKIPPVKMLEIYKYLEFENWKEFYLWLTEGLDLSIDSYNNILSLKEYVNILLKGFKNINLIDATLDVVSSVAKFPKWINKVEYIKELKRYILLNLYDEINTGSHPVERENDDDYQYLTGALLKAIRTMEEEFLINTDLFPVMGEKFSNTAQIHNMK